jgi:two-component system LytT family response regulator
MKVLIADDEKEARALVTHFLHELHPSCIIKECVDGNTTMLALQTINFDIVFLDVKMPGISGVDILKTLQSEELPAIIFTTAFDKHALTAFDHDAVDYLLKPFNKARFGKALAKAIDYTKLKALKKQKTYLSSIPIKRGNKITLLPVAEIEFFETRDEYISAVTASGNNLLNTTLSELETQLNPGVFIRVHKSTIMNTQFIKKIESQASGDMIIITKTGKSIRASRNFKERIKTVLSRIKAD